METLQERTARLLTTECVSRAAWQELVTDLQKALGEAMNDEPRQAQQPIVDAQLSDYSAGASSMRKEAVPVIPAAAPGEIADALVSMLVADISDRAGLGNEWDNIDDDIQQEIRAQWKAQIAHELKKRATPLSVGHDASSEPEPNKPNAVDAVREALAELVRLKDAKERYGPNGYWDNDAARVDYDKSQPLAWERARALLEGKHGNVG